MANNIIIVGVDGSESARKAARRAAELAKSTGATLHVISAVDKLSVETIPAGGGTTRTLTSGEAAESIAAEVAAELKQITPDVVSDPHPGKPAEALVDEAIRLDASLIVVGNRRVQGIGRLLGSVATDVAQRAPCDVYIVKTV
jgi:nucleotide-binding universal stress UspA family protein